MSRSKLTKLRGELAKVEKGRGKRYPERLREQNDGSEVWAGVVWAGVRRYGPACVAACAAGVPAGPDRRAAAGAFGWAPEVRFESLGVRLC
jgi:hypothetical protein